MTLKFVLWGLLFLLFVPLHGIAYFLTYHGINDPGYFIRFCAALWGALLLAWVLHYLNKKYSLKQPHSYSCARKPHIKWIIAIITISVIFYTFLAILLSTAWLKGDDFLFLPEKSFKASFCRALAHYSEQVSRLGEAVGMLIKLSPTRWELYLSNPLLAVLLPWGVLRLVGNGKTHLFSAAGCCYFVFSFFLFLLSCKVIGGWRNYWCWAASVNYYWPTVAAIFFLSFYRTRNFVLNSTSWKKNIVSKSFLFLMGVCSCWGGEVLTVTIIPLLTFWIIYMLIKKIYIPSTCIWGYIGAAWGGAMLFISPSLQRRADAYSSTRSLDIGSLSPEALSDFCCNLTQEKVMMLMDGACITNLSGIPMHLHLYFLPYLTETYTKCAFFSIILFILIFILLSIQKHKKRGTYILRALAIAMLSYYSACAYLVGAIPTGMSFLPPVFILSCASCYMYLRLPYKWAPQLACMLLTAATALAIFVPSGIEAWKHKEINNKRIQYINQQRERGIQDIVIAPLFNIPPKDELKLIGSKQDGLGDNPTGYPNSEAAKKFNVKTIIQKW